MFWNKSKSSRVEINWERLTEASQLEQIVEESKERPVLIYKIMLILYHMKMLFQTLTQVV